ncbi:hypothetical protein GP486_008180, partial [Trichoglossum hirsutum]
MSARQPASKKPTIGTMKEPHDAMAMQGARPANDEEVQEVLHHMGRTLPEDDNEEMTRWPVAYEASIVRREMLCQKADDEDEEAPGLTEAEFYERLQDPKALYQELAELIQRTRDLKAIGENYCKQLYKAKQAFRNSTVTRTPAPHEGIQRTTKLPDPLLFDSSIKNEVTYDNWLIQVENKLRGNADAYPTEDLKIIYVASQVSSDALALISPRL